MCVLASLLLACCPALPCLALPYVHTPYLATCERMTNDDWWASGIVISLPLGVCTASLRLLCSGYVCVCLWVIMWVGDYVCVWAGKWACGRISGEPRRSAVWACVRVVCMVHLVWYTWYGWVVGGWLVGCTAAPHRTSYIDLWGSALYSTICVQLMRPTMTTHKTA